MTGHFTSHEPRTHHELATRASPNLDPVVWGAPTLCRWKCVDRTCSDHPATVPPDGERRWGAVRHWSLSACS